MTNEDELDVLKFNGDIVAKGLFASWEELAVATRNELNAEAHLSEEQQAQEDALDDIVEDWGPNDTRTFCS